MNSFAINYAQLEDTFRRLAEHDGTIYLPNPAPAGPVDFIFIAMEPSTSGLGVETMATRVSQGYKNFLFSIDDFCLHYSIRTFLCGPGEAYHVTDISKGPIFVKEAKEDRWPRWDRWLPSLRDEIDLVAKPSARILAVGKEAANFLDREGLKKLDGTILHFSAQAVRWRKRAVKGREAEFERFAASVALEDVIAVVEAAIAEARFPERMRQQLLDNLPGVLSLSQKQLVFTYKVAFEALESCCTP